MSEQSKAERRRLWQPMERGIRSVLLEWDPIGAGVPDDEYDCLIWPVVRQLESGVDTAQLAGWLREHMDAHFGLGSLQGTDQAAESLHAVWASLRA